ncbi:type II toxin-antitoxin system VapC family toxin [Gloeocapsa sp. PCC 73106]|uniref:type II toxin-antitoxin system VapC family toxin n=1 Tax=Gloeocapsa sp. PCC 73106 TaxID=102232 RepID=UPI0002ACD2A7|nr:type II toxin-antitoxin system VapC family toxin [Gloeocapsa sp. PCC 73106]ELR99755.1 putative nucleic acid-binding protein [Gloeocapsa sp. PCC 73106]
MYLLDTNICIAIFKNNENAVNNFRSKYKQSYLSTLVLGELYKGVYCSSKVEQNLTNINHFVSQLRLIVFDEKAALEFGKIQSELRKIGKPTGHLDALIAGVARSRNDILVTDNTRHFENIANLHLENWLVGRFQGRECL